MRILIAEDDFVSRKLLQKFLSTYGTCDIAVDGMEAVDSFLHALAEGEPYRLICLDIMMPKMDGMQVLKTIKDMEKQRGIGENEAAKIIMTTALNERDTVTSSYDLGCDAYAWKPINLEKLKEVISKMGLA